VDDWRVSWCRHPLHGRRLVGRRRHRWPLRRNRWWTRGALQQQWRWPSPQGRQRRPSTGAGHHRRADRLVGLARPANAVVRLDGRLRLASPQVTLCQSLARLAVSLVWMNRVALQRRCYPAVGMLGPAAVATECRAFVEPGRPAWQVGRMERSPASVVILAYALCGFAHSPQLLILWRGIVCAGSRAEGSGGNSSPGA